MDQNNLQQYFQIVKSAINENIINTKQFQTFIIFSESYLHLIAIPLLIIPLVISFWLGQKSANRAKFFSQKLKKVRAHVKAIKNTASNLESRLTTLKFLQRIYKYLLLMAILFSLVDYFLMEKIFLKKIFDIDLSLVLTGVVDIEEIAKIAGIFVTVSFHFILKFFIRYTKAGQEHVVEQIQTEEKIISDLVTKFMEGLGENFKNIVKRYLQLEYNSELKALENHFENLQEQFENEKPEVEKVEKISNFFGEIYIEIKKFNWCKKCINQIKNKKTPKKNYEGIKTVYHKTQGKNFSDEENSSNGQVSSENFKSSDCGGRRPMSEANMIGGLYRPENDNRNGMGGEEIICKEECLKKLFKQVLDLRRKFEDKADLWD